LPLVLPDPVEVCVRTPRTACLAEPEGCE